MKETNNTVEPDMITFARYRCKASVSYDKNHVCLIPDLTTPKDNNKHPCNGKGGKGTGCKRYVDNFYRFLMEGELYCFNDRATMHSLSEELLKEIKACAIRKRIERNL